MSSGQPTSFLNVPARLRVDSEEYYSSLRQALYDLRVALPCVVVSFDPVAQTVKVQPAVRERLNRDRTGDYTGVPTDVDLPQLINVPIVVPRAGGLSLTFPINPGDECLVVFADMCYDAWWQSGGTANAQADKRRHDLSDGVAIFGVWSQPRVLPGYSQSSVQLRTDDGLTFLEVIAGQVFVEGNLVVGNGATGTFTSQDGRTVTVQNGIVVNIA